MARSMWTGAISFGLVTVPVRLFSAVEDKGISFRQLQKGTGSRIRYQRVAEDNGKEVEYGDIVKGYEIDKGRYVVVTPEELEAVEPGRSRTIDISDFVDLGAIDPIHFDRTYYLAPAEDVGAEKPYALLLQAMKDTGKVAVARFVMRGKQYLAAIRPMTEPSGEELLALETMHFPDEVRTAEDVDGIPVKAELSDRERRMAEQLIDSLSSDWDPAQYCDTYRERVLDLIERKAKGEDVVVEEPEEAPQVTDLLAALQASVEASRQRKAGGGSGGGGGSPASTGGGLADLSKDELYERASEADISGRSKMTKEELVEALQEEAS